MKYLFTIYMGFFMGYHGYHFDSVEFWALIVPVTGLVTCFNNGK